MAQSFILSFQHNLTFSEESPDNFILQSPYFTFPLKSLSPGLATAIKLLTTEGATEDTLSELVLEKDGFSGLPKFYYYLEQFTNLGLICWTLIVDEVPFVKLVPFSPAYKFQLPDAQLDKKYTLSRFAYCHKENSTMVLESPLIAAKILLLNWQSNALVSELAQTKTGFDLLKILELSSDSIQTFLSLLLANQMIQEVQEDGKTEEEENESLAQWEFHDLLFHSRSRNGRQASPSGKTYRFLGQINPLPVLKPQPSLETIELYKPDLQNLQEYDIPFTQVLETRKSIREYGEKPITAQQLGEFLYRSARIKEIVPRDTMECSKRVYPSGGASYELELYLVINHCQNIESGFYYYNPKEHQICKISGKNSQVETLLTNAENATGIPCNPQVLIIFSARFARVSWAYESVAYALILKHVGVLYQTMYLVATAMDLAPCAIGTGNSDLFAAATGCDYLAESSVGEFILGSKPFSNKNIVC